MEYLKLQYHPIIAITSFIHAWTHVATRDISLVKCQICCKNEMRQVVGLSLNETWSFHERWHFHDMTFPRDVTLWIYMHEKSYCLCGYVDQ